eukprot:NODE_281_length_10828_cov_0.749837.p3 type:complete len:391 gc:universal NODE_281_length_10828_cov_0.749837:6802-7974(+)
MLYALVPFLFLATVLIEWNPIKSIKMIKSNICQMRDASRFTLGFVANTNQNHPELQAIEQKMHDLATHANPCHAHLWDEMVQSLLVLSHQYHGTKAQIRQNLLTDTLSQINQIYQFEWIPQFHENVFEKLQNSKKSLLIFNHIGANDFQVAMQLLNHVNRLNQMRFITLQFFEDFAPIPKFKKFRLKFKNALMLLDALLIDKDPMKTKQNFDGYVKQHENENIAIILFPEGDLLNQDTYEIDPHKNQELASKLNRDKYENMNFPRSGGIQRILDGFPDMDVFDITNMYVNHKNDVGNASQGRFMGDQYSVVNVALRGKYPKRIHSYIRQIDNPRHLNNMDTAAYRTWAVDLWDQKNQKLGEMSQKYQSNVVVENIDELESDLVNEHNKLN